MNHSRFYFQVETLISQCFLFSLSAVFLAFQCQLSAWVLILTSPLPRWLTFWRTSKTGSFSCTNTSNPKDKGNSISHLQTIYQELITFITHQSTPCTYKCFSKSELFLTFPEWLSFISFFSYLEFYWHDCIIKTVNKCSLHMSAFTFKIVSLFRHCGFLVSYGFFFFQP